MNALLAFQWPFLPSEVERLGWVLIHSLWQFTIVTLLAGLAARTMRRHSPSTRYGVFVMAMSASVVAAVATWMFLAGDGPALVVSRAASNPSWSAGGAIDPRADASMGPRSAAKASAETEVPMRAIAPSSVASEPPQAASPVASAVMQPTATWSQLAESIMRPWMSWIVAAWGLGVVVCSLRLLLGWRTLRRLRRVGVSPVSDEVLAAMRRLSERLGVRRAVGVLQSTMALVPMVIGYVRPVILLPLGLVTSISAAQLETILAHELTHVRRHDFVVNLLQTLVETLFFYHPAVWWLSRQIRMEREHCCDDQVVKLLDNRVEYGRALVAIGELRGRNTVLALGANDGPLLSRVRRIVGVVPDRSSACLSARWPVAFVGLVTLGLVVTIALAAQTSDSKPQDGAKLERGMEERLRWGEPANGLRAAVAIRPAPAEPKIGVEQEIYLVVQNVSDGPIRFSDTTTAPELRKLYLKHDGVPQSATVIDKATMTDVVLQPREVAYLRMFPPSSRGTSEHTRGALLATILMKNSHQSVVAQLQIKQAPSGAWTGKLVTGDTTYATAGSGDRGRAPLEFRVAANPAGSDIEPRVPKDFLQRHYPDNTTEGRAAAKDQGFIWVPLAKPSDGRVDLPLERTRGEQRHALLGDTADTSLVLDGERRAVTSEAVPDQSQPNHWSIHVKLDEAAGVALRRLTKMHLNQKLAIVVEGKVIAAPVIRSEIGKDVMISGNFSQADAARLAQLLLKQGNEPHPNDPEAKAQTLRMPALLLPDHWILNSVGFDNGGKELVTASQQGVATIRRWDVAGRKLISEIKLLSPKHGLGFHQGSLKLSHDCRQVLALTDEFVGLWDATTGELLMQLPFPKVGDNDTIYMLDATPDFSTIVGSLGTAYLTTALLYDAHSVVWDGATGAVRRTLTHTNGTRTTAMTLSPDGKWLGTTNGYGVSVWDVSNGTLVREIEHDKTDKARADSDRDPIYRDHVWSLHFAPDSKQLAIIDGISVKLVEAHSGKLLRRLEGGYRYSSVPSPPLVYSPDGQRLARLGTGSSNDIGYVIPIWSTQTGQKLFELHTNANDACFTNDGRQLAVGFSDFQRALSVWNLSSDANDVEQAGPEPQSRQERVEVYGHYRGKNAAEFIDRFKPVWSESTLGIQYGIAFHKQPAQFRSGERVPLVFFFRNTSDKPLKLDMRPDYDGNTPTMLNVKGEAVNLENVALLGDVAHYVETLQPGESVAPFYASFGLGENPLPGKQHWHPFVKSPQLGKYTLKHTLSINVSEAKDGAPGSRQTITSESLSFEIVD